MNMQTRYDLEVLLEVKEKELNKIAPFNLLCNTFIL